MCLSVMKSTDSRKTLQYSIGGGRKEMLRAEIVDVQSGVMDS